MNILYLLILVLGLCVAIPLAYYWQNYQTRVFVQSLIAEADKAIMSRFGLSYDRAQLAWSSESRSRAVLSLRRTVRWRLLGGVPSTRSERHFLSSASDTLETNLEIRRERLCKVEMVATPGCIPAAEHWAKHVRARLPNVEFVINGNVLK